MSFLGRQMSECTGRRVPDTLSGGVDNSSRISYATKGEQKANMNAATELRKQIESTLAHRIPAALSTRPAAAPELVSCGVAEVDAALGGGLPLGAISELTGAVSSGRTTLTWATLANITLEGGSGAYVDVSDSFDPLSAAALGVDLRRMLWIRAVTRSGVEAGMGMPAAQNVIPALSANAGALGRGGHHPRTEAVGVDRAVSRLFSGSRLATDLAGGDQLLSEPRDFTPRCSESIRRKRIEPVIFAPQAGPLLNPPMHARRDRVDHKPWGRLDRALRATDLLLSAGGFRVVVLDMGDVSPEYARRVPLTTWYRFRLQAEKSQALFLLLTQAACANSCAAVSLHCEEPQAEWKQAAENSPALLTGVRHLVSISRNRVVDSNRKPAASVPLYAKDARSVDPESTFPGKSAHGTPAKVSWTSTTLWSR
jgi:hypothetical protein